MLAFPASWPSNARGQASTEKTAQQRAPRLTIARRCCSPGTTAIAVACRGARCPARTPILIACGSARSCCSRRRSRPSVLISRASSSAGRMSKRLALAKLDDVLHAWQGLGYYARARNLHACAQAVVAQHDGKFPASEAALLSLPGIGAYTAAAIAAIAFNQHAAPVDGNIERVDRAALCGDDAAARGEARIARVCAATLGAERSPRRFRASGDGFGRDDLHAAKAQMRALPVARGLPRADRRHRRGFAGAAGEACQAVAPRRRLLGGARRRRGAAAQAARERPARRDDGSAVERMA